MERVPDDQDDVTQRGSWRAGCGGSRTSGSGDGPEKPTAGNNGTALRSDPTGRPRLGLATPDTATPAIIETGTLRRRYLRVPGRITRSARHRTLHLPTRWPWATEFTTALTRLRALPAVT